MNIFFNSVSIHVSRMPRAPSVAHELLLRTVLDSADDVMDDNGLVKGPSHAVWRKISSAVDNKLKPGYIYLYVKENRHQVLHELQKIKNIPVPPETPIIDDSSLTVILEESSFEVDDCNSVQPSRNFQMVFTPEEWNFIKPVRKKYKRADRPGDRYVKPSRFLVF